MPRQTTLAHLLWTALLLLATPAASSPEAIWRELGFPYDYEHSAVYDSARHRMVVFRAKSVRPGDVALVSLAPSIAWDHLVPLGERPSDRDYAAAVYDPVDDRMIVVGGFGPSNMDVWELSFRSYPTWTRLVPADTVPERRFGHSAIYDPIGHRVIVFGGHVAGEISNEIWELSLGQPVRWTPLATAGGPPGSRSQHSAIYDPDHHQMVVFGGVAGAGGIVGDTWALGLDGTPTWRYVFALDGPPSGGRSWHLAVFDSRHHRMIVSGGYSTNSDGEDETWELSLSPGAERWSRFAVSGAVPSLFDHVGVFDPVEDRLVVHGGIGNSGATNRVSALAVGGSFVWQALGPDGRPGGVPLVHDPVRDEYVTVSGGKLWRRTPGSSVWETLPTTGTPPANLSDHALVYDPVRDRLLVWAGDETGVGWTNTIRAVTLTEPRTWSVLSATGTPPSGRVGSSAIYDPLGDRLVLFGGADLALPRNDVWSVPLAAPSWNLLATAGPAPNARRGHLALYDDSRQRMVIHGGAGGFLDTWVLSLNGGTPTWSLLTPSGVPSGSRTGVYDPVGDRMIVIDSDVRTLTFSPPAWGTLSTVGVPPAAQAAAYDPVRRRIPVKVADTDWELDFDLTQLTGAPVRPGRPANGLEILSVQPNPAAARFTLRFALPSGGDAAVEWFDLAGRRMERRALGVLGAGVHTIPFERGRTYRPGVYVIRVTQGGKHVSKRIVLTD